MDFPTRPNAHVLPKLKNKSTTLHPAGGDGALHGGRALERARGDLVGRRAVARGRVTRRRPAPRRAERPPGVHRHALLPRRPQGGHT